ncbi:MAG: sialidase family protein [Candidatus Dormibacteria bacterium]
MTPPERVMLIYTMPPPTLVADDKGEVLAAWHDARNGDWDVFLRASNDLGRSWGKLHRLNDDALNNGRHQYLPHLSVAPNGRLDVVFYDRRRDPQNLRNDTYYTFSLDAGASFATNLRITSQSSNSRVGQTYLVPSAKGLVEFGSRLASLSRDSGVLLAWTDTRNASGSHDQDIFAAELVFATDGSSRAPFVAVGLLVLATLSVAAAILRITKGSVVPVRRRRPGAV